MPSTHEIAVSGAFAELRRGQSAKLTGGTSAVAAADRGGSGLVVPGLDLYLVQSGRSRFHFSPRPPQFPLPGHRPLTTLHAWAPVATAGWLFGATPGGEQQVPWNAQTLAHLLGGDSEAQALTRPRGEFDAFGLFAARSSHVLVRTDHNSVSVTADPRLDGRAAAV